MTWVDVFICLLAIAAIIRGLSLGLVRQLFSATGFFGGLFAGVWLQGTLVQLGHTSAERALLSLLVILGSAFFCLIIGEHIGDALKAKLAPLHVDKLDGLLGSLTATVTILLAVWLGANIFANLPSASWQHQMQQSYILSRLNRVMPPAPNVIARIGHIITPNGFPQVFTGLEPKPQQSDVTIPNMDELTGVVRQVAPSVVKIEGEGCGGIVDGSGFVARDGLVITNAHVVAGVTQPQVIDGNGRHKTTVVWFDPNLDFAVLRTTNLAGEPLPIVTQLAPTGTPATVLGYPGGGSFKADPAAVIESFTAIGRNIYDQENTSREVYSLKADVIGGNSGGPLVNKDGQVIGIIFAHSTSYEHVGYALTMQQTVDKLTQAEQNRTPVATGSCAE